jgi:dethiobiotin synthetase
MSARGLFVTGTDTDSGKTLITLGLMRAFAGRGERVLAMKPVAAGAQAGADGLRNDDALQLLAAGSFEVDYDTLNPYCFEPPIAPHIAAAEAGVEIDGDHLMDCRDRLAAQCDRLLVEGAGGWRVPLNTELDMAGLARRLAYPVVLVVGMRLGCLNHALLTAESIDAAGLRLAGWVANRIDPGMSRYDQNLASLKTVIPAPLLGEVPWLDHARAETVADRLTLTGV